MLLLRDVCYDICLDLPESIINLEGMKKYIIFDFDGTIANTNDIIVESWEAALTHFLGHTLPRREIEATFGETLYYTIGRLVPGANVDDVVDYYRAYQDANQEGKVYVFGGVRELMTELRERGYRIGVATSRTAYSYNNYMEQLGMEGLVDEVVTMEDVSSHKPDPESIEAVLRKLSPDADPSEAIMIGDTKFDIGCANNAHVDSVLVGWSHYVDEEDMAAAGFEPTYRIDKPEELLRVL